MDRLDRNIKNILTKEIDKPQSYHNAIKYALNNKQKNKANIIYKEFNFAKVTITACATIILTTGIVFATKQIYENIWKEPKKYSPQQGISEEEKKNCISEEQATKIGNDYLNKIGFNDQNIINLNLQKELRSNDNVWSLSSEKVLIDIDANTGKIKRVYISSTEYERTKNYGITREEARITAKELLEKYRPEYMEGEYELVSLKRNSEIDKNAYIWYADFYRKYGDLLNENEHINIGWIPTINGLYSLDIQNDKYEENEEKITKDEAINIATLKDSEITKNRKIKNVKAEIRIKKMNEQVFLREKFAEEYENDGTLNFNYEKTDENMWQLKKDAVFYETEGRVRKVWVVVIEYEEGKIPLYSYFVDSTTGEIIGGATWNLLESEKTIRNDPNNVIEK